MPITARWRMLTRLPPPRGRDAMPGVYELADASKRVVYIGQSATDVPNRLRQHLVQGSCVAERAVYWRWRFSLVPQSEEADLLAEHVRRHGRVPECNVALPQVRDGRRRWIERSSSR
jgi:hypothetical protein